MRITIQILVCAAALSAFATSAFAEKVSVDFENKSKWAIHQIFLSSSDTKEWGPDQLGDKDSDVIASGGKFTLNQIEPGKYDMKIVDEDGDECVLASLKLGQNKVVDITDENLLNCQSQTEAAAE